MTPEQKGLVTDIVGIIRQRDVSFPVEMSTLEFFMLTVYGEDRSDEIAEAVEESQVLELGIADYHDVDDVDHQIEFVKDSTKWDRRKAPRSEKCDNCRRVVGEGDWLYQKDNSEYWCEACMKKEAMVDNLESFTK